MRILISGGAFFGLPGDAGLPPEELSLGIGSVLTKRGVSRQASAHAPDALGIPSRVADVAHPSPRIRQQRWEMEENVDDGNGSDTFVPGANHPCMMSHGGPHLAEIDSPHNT
jgi:hypothetical protein